MSEETTTKYVKDDEIDLLDLFRRMGNGLAIMFRTLGRWILISIVFMIRRWIPLLISILIGLGAAYLLKLTSKSFYTSDLVLKTNSVPASDLISYINRLHIYSEEDNISELATSLSLSPSQLQNIDDITAHWIIDLGNDGIPDIVDLREKHDVYDTINIRMTDRMNVRVRINEPQELGNLKSGILKFIHSDSLYQQRNRLRLKQNNELLQRINYDISQLDSLQKVKYFEETRARRPQGSGQMVFLQEQNTQLVYPDIHKLYENKQVIERDNELYRDIVTVLSDFSLPALRINGGGYYAKITVPILFGLTLLVLILLANKERISELFRKY